MDTIECLHAGVPAPRTSLAMVYAVIFMALAFALIPADWGPARFIAAIAVGWWIYEFLKKHGPGRASWWTRLSDQLWSYDPIDRRALETLRRELVEHARQGKRRALVRMTRWARSELAAIGGATDRAEAR
ncbi:MAG: hypothetical protein ACP5P4_14860 [Steroidobacteraceae bacterium]